MKSIQTVVGDIQSVILENQFLSVEILSYGASIFHLYVKNKDEKIEVSVQPDDINEFLTSQFYYGKTVGRTAGRLFYPSYSIGNTEYLLDDTSNPSLLHGGENGFSFKHFEIAELSEAHVKLKAVSYADEGPYDGILTLFTTYQISNNTLEIVYEAHTTETTLCNITNHVYLNLTKQPTIDDHHMTIHADTYLNIDDNNKIISVEPVKEPLDFNQGLKLKEALNIMENTSFKGFDHTFIFSEDKHVQMEVETDTLKMMLKTTNPSVVLYTHNKPAPHQLRHLGKEDNKHAAFTIETQYEPGGIQFEGLNHAVLKPKDTYYETTTLEFHVKNIK
jgi:aldose 1-epimerase